MQTIALFLELERRTFAVYYFELKGSSHLIQNDILQNSFLVWIKEDK